MDCNIKQVVTENLDVTNKLDEVEKNWEKGFWEGQESLAKPLPSFIHNKKALMWKPYERGYWFGREMALIERNIKRESI